MSIEDIIKSYSFTKKEWEEVTRIKLSEEKSHPEISEEEALRRAARSVRNGSRSQRREFYKSEFME